MKSVERLVNRLRAEGWIIPDDWKFQRLYPGYWQRSAGAWSWTITGTMCDIGSCDSVARCLKASSLNRHRFGEIIAD
jgi:hypothetical protein